MLIQYIGWIMKKIIHIDADCFYAAVEMRENPELTSVPLAVGGSPASRGVIATCNYEARKFGVHSAMPSSLAIKLCPFLQIVPPRISLYKQYSSAMHSVFSEYTNLIEPLSLDEAFLDVSESENCHGSATLIARQIRQQIETEVGISVSAGVAPVKFLAKIASDWKKPNGLYVIEPKMVSCFVPGLPVNKLPGVGPVTSEKLARYGIYNCADLQTCGLDQLIRLFGSFGTKLHKMSHGKDDREVKPNSQRKSVSVEKTYAEDVNNLSALFPRLDDLLSDLDRRVCSANVADKACKAFVKLKFNDFSITTVETSLGRNASLQAAGATKDIYGRLLSAAWQRKKLPVRLLGVGVRLSSLDPSQLDLDLDLAHLMDADVVDRLNK